MRLCGIFAASLGIACTLASAAPSAVSAPSFASRAEYATGKAPRSVAIGDLDGDRKPDLAVADAGDGTVTILFNKGDGRFRPRESYDDPDAAWAVAIGDLNGDGRSEVVAANQLDTILVLVNNGTPFSTSAPRTGRTRIRARSPSGTLTGTAHRIS